MFHVKHPFESAPAQQQLVAGQANQVAAAGKGEQRR
jgi:hypothetical protein